MYARFCHIGSLEVSRTERVSEFISSDGRKSTLVRPEPQMARLGLRPVQLNPFIHSAFRCWWVPPG